ncbi:MAG: hypothetical protein BWY20_02165 [Spirochaetes bacterium ADurb.Bin215]|nr:MAG: hypothetical protein BWY20_02165 [Spirochaetes bacterium ADurb.Bin215]
MLDGNLGELSVVDLVPDLRGLVVVVHNTRDNEVFPDYFIFFRKMDFHHRFVCLGVYGKQPGVDNILVSGGIRKAEFHGVRNRFFKSSHKGIGKGRLFHRNIHGLITRGTVARRAVFNTAHPGRVIVAETDKGFTVNNIARFGKKRFNNRRFGILGK